MSKTRVIARVLEPHDHSIDTDDFTYHELVAEGYEVRDSVGRPHRNGRTLWFKAACNNPDCKAAVLVSEHSLIETAEYALDELAWGGEKMTVTSA